ncbi:MAG: rhodanese-like domain-containing protein [Campylobacterales bacterium]
MENESILSAEACEALLRQEELKPRELRRLMAARSAGSIDFMLIDVREEAKHKLSRIRGTDGRFEAADQIALFSPPKDRAIVLYCQAGIKSRELTKPLKSAGYQKVCNLAYGILGYQGEIEKE